MSPLLNLKDVSQTLEILRRTRRDMADGQNREAIDRQIVVLTEHITGMIGEDERLVHVRDAEQALLRSKPKGVNWDMLLMGGVRAALIAQVIAGEAVDEVWQTFAASK